MGLLAMGLLVASAGSQATAACLSPSEAASWVAQFMDKQPAANPVGLSAEDGECTRNRVNQLLELALGRAVGYKVTLTDADAQKRFHAQAPVWGLLYAPMLLPDGPLVRAAYGVRPWVEAGLLVRVSDARINQARDPRAVLDAIDQVIPFIELADLAVQAPDRLDAAGLVAINAGARLGVVGKPLTVQRNAEFLKHLGTMNVVVSGDGGELDHRRGTQVLNHPLNAVVWLVQDLARNGRALRKGDLVGLGAYSRPLQPRPGLSVVVRYEGLQSGPVVRVGFK